MTSSLISHIAIHSDNQRLLVPPDFDESAIAEIVGQKAQVLASLRKTQIDAAGFYRTFPAALRFELEAAPWVALGIATTADTRFSPPERLSATSAVGSDTWLAYRVSHPGARLSTTPRVRALYAHAPDLGSYSWDLDALSTKDRQQLLKTVLDKKIIVAHDAGFILSWLLSETPARPSFVLDTMLLARQLRPLTLLNPFAMAAAGDDDARGRVRKLIERERGAPSASSEWIAASLRLPGPDRWFRPQASWCVTKLSSFHHDYTRDVLDLHLQAIGKLFKGVDVGDMPGAIQRQYPWYIPFSDATIRLADAHVRGVPFHLEAAESLKSDLLQKIKMEATGLAQSPGLSGMFHQLSDPDVGVTQEMKTALREIPTQNQSTSAESASFRNLNKIKATYRWLEEQIQAAMSDGMLHSMITFSTATGRTSSVKPCLQNFPRDPAFRGLVKARPDHFILSLDYGSIELRIAASLAERTISDLRERIASDCEEDWFLRMVKIGVNAENDLQCPPEPDRWNLEWLNQAIPDVAQTVMHRDCQTMTSILQRGLDPHLVTAIDLAHRQGKMECEPNPVEWLAGKDGVARKELKSVLKVERQRAKSANFGLLYGMSAGRLHRYGISDHGVSWTLAQATDARSAWFALYPEFRLWQWWTKYRQVRKIAPTKCLVWDDFNKVLNAPEYDVSLFETSTLTGRPLAILDQFKAALNYQDQGTGADILAAAIASLPQRIAGMLLMPVHDELVFEVPQSEAETIKAEVMDVMKQVAGRIIGTGIPIEVDAELGYTWG